MIVSRALKVFLSVILFLSAQCGVMGDAYGAAAENKPNDPGKENPVAVTAAKPAAPKLTRRSVKISAVGDCTIGWDDRFNWGNRFDAYLESNNGDYGYYLAKVRDVFREDDLTIANLETTFSLSLFTFMNWRRK